MSDREDTVIVERRDAVLWLTIDRPERRNALNGVVFDALAGALAEADGAAFPVSSANWTGTDDRNWIFQIGRRSIIALPNQPWGGER